MIAEHPQSITPAPTLVNTLTDQLMDVLMRAATEALTETQCRTLRPRVARLIAAGRIDNARALVSDSVAVHCLQREISRHMYGECPRCPLHIDHCDVLRAMESREERMLSLIAQSGAY